MKEKKQLIGLSDHHGYNHITHSIIRGSIEVCNIRLKMITIEYNHDHT